MIDWTITALIIVQLLTLGALQSRTHMFEHTVLKENKGPFSRFKTENHRVGWWEWQCIREQALLHRTFLYPPLVHERAFHLPRADVTKAGTRATIHHHGTQAGAGWRVSLVHVLQMRQPRLQEAKCPDQSHSLTGGLHDSNSREFFPLHHPAFRLSTTLTYHKAHSSWTYKWLSCHHCHCTALGGATPHT